MRQHTIDTVLSSCTAAENFLKSDTGDDLDLQIAGYIEIFKKAAIGENVSEIALKKSVTEVFWLSSTDMLPVTSRFPGSYNALQALKPAANRFYDRVYN